MLKLRSLNGNRLGNYSAVPALCGSELGGNVKMVDDKTASKEPKSAPGIEVTDSAPANVD